MLRILLSVYDEGLSDESPRLPGITFFGLVDAEYAPLEQPQQPIITANWPGFHGLAFVRHAPKHMEITMTEAGSSDGEHHLARHWARRWDILEFKWSMDANKTKRFHHVLPSLILPGEQPEDLPPAARMRLVGLAIRQCELVAVVRWEARCILLIP